MRRRNPTRRETWVNGSTCATALAIAHAFASESLPASSPLNQPSMADLWKRSYDPSKRKGILKEYWRSEFGSPQEFAAHHQLQALCLKADMPGFAGAAREKALQSFRRAERSCGRVNRRLRFYNAHPERENPLMRVILARARRIISDTLGTFTEVTLENLLSLSHPGSGLALGTLPGHRDATSLGFKLHSHRLCCTAEALPYARLLVESSPIWVDSIMEKFGELRYEITRSNRVTFVPKDATTRRTIAIEPHLNVMLQLGVHEYIRRRLKSVCGLDLGNQFNNQRAARDGSLNWESVNPLCTIDLSAASDSLSIGLVERLLPSGWFGYLQDIRSVAYQLDKEDPVVYQKWSSMGNGYTFALETLVFWALGRASQSFVDGAVDPIVYGDDIICSRSHALLYLETLRYAGFSANVDKTFLFGPFRESCGADWWAGVDVTPVYIRGPDTLRHTDVYRLINRLGGSNPYLRRYLESSLSGPILYGLENEDDSSCIFVSTSEAERRGVLRWNRRIQNHEFLVARFRASARRVPQVAAYAASLFGAFGGNQWKDDQVSLSLRRKGVWTLIRRTPGRVIPTRVGAVT